MRPVGSSVTDDWMGMRLPELGERLARGEDLRLHLEHVLARLEDQHVGPALDEPERLIEEAAHEVFQRQLAEIGILGRRQHARWAHRARDEARPAVALLVPARDVARDRGGGAVDLARPLAQPPFVEPDARCLERVGLDRIGARVEVGGVDRLDHVRPRDRQQVVAAFLAVEVRRGQVAGVDLRSHAPVVDEDALAQCL
jgi:hypothetical protein